MVLGIAAKKANKEAISLAEAPPYLGTAAPVWGAYNTSDKKLDRPRLGLPDPCWQIPGGRPGCTCGRCQPRKTPPAREHLGHYLTKFPTAAGLDVPKSFQAFADSDYATPLSDKQLARQGSVCDEDESFYFTIRERDLAAVLDVATKVEQRLAAENVRHSDITDHSKCMQALKDRHKPLPVPPPTNWTAIGDAERRAPAVTMASYFLATNYDPNSWGAIRQGFTVERDVQAAVVAALQNLTHGGLVALEGGARDARDSFGLTTLLRMSAKSVAANGAFEGGPPKWDNCRREHLYLVDKPNREVLARLLEWVKNARSNGTCPRFLVALQPANSLAQKQACLDAEHVVIQAPWTPGDRHLIAQRKAALLAVQA